MNPYFNFGEDDFNPRADNTGWRKYGFIANAKSKSLPPNAPPTNFGSFDPNASVNQRAMGASGGNAYFDPQPTDSDIMGGQADPEIGGALEQANTEYFAPKTQMSADDQIMGGSIDPTVERIATDPYFGRPMNQDKDPMGHQKLAATPEEVKDGQREYADGVRQAQGDLNDAIRAANDYKPGLRVLVTDKAQFEAEKQQKIATAQAIYQSKVNALNNTLRAQHPEYFAPASNPPTHRWAHDNHGNLYDAAAENPTVLKGVLPVGDDPRAKADADRVANEARRLELQQKRDEETAKYHDKWLALQQGIIGARDAWDKAQAETKADREINRDIIKIEADKIKAVQDAEAAAQFGDKDAPARIAKQYDDLLAKANAMRGGGGGPTTSAPPQQGQNGPPRQGAAPRDAGIPTTYKGKPGKKYKNPDGTWRFVAGA